MYFQIKKYIISGTWGDYMKDNNQQIEYLEKKNKKYNLFFSLIIALGLPIAIVPPIIIWTLFSEMFFISLSAFLFVGGIFGLMIGLDSVKNKIEKNNQKIAKLKINKSAKELTNEEVELAKAVLKARESLIGTESLTKFLNSSEEFKVVKDTIYNNKVMDFINEIEENKTIDFLPVYNHDEFNLEISNELQNKPKQKFKRIRR